MRQDTYHPGAHSDTERFNRMVLALYTGLATLIPTVVVTGWPGHEWENWREVATWKQPAVASDQAGRSDLVSVLGEGDQRASSRFEWNVRRAHIKQIIERHLGTPTDLKKPPVEVETLGEELLPDHVRRHIRIRCEEDDWIPAYLLTPHELPARPAPAIICLHQTQVPGKQETCGMTGNPDMAFALELVRRGHICIAPDVIGFGERIPPGGQVYDNTIDFFKRHPGWSCMGKMNWDIGRVIDYLETLKFVDATRIGCIGHSHGAYGGLFAAAFEPRIAAVVASCGFTTFRGDPSPDRWSHRTPLIPQLGTYLPDVGQIPFDWQHVCSLIAPKPMYVWFGTKDDIFPQTENLDNLFRDVRHVYDLYGAGDRIEWHSFAGPHSLPPTARRHAYAWLERQLGISARESNGTTRQDPVGPVLNRPSFPSAPRRLQ